MKRIVLLLLSIHLMGFLAGAQGIPKYFWGYKLGDHVTKSGLASRTGANVEIDRSVTEDNITAYSVHAPKQILGITWDEFVFCLDKKGELCTVRMAINKPHVSDETDVDLSKDDHFLMLKEKVSILGIPYLDMSSETKLFVEAEDKSTMLTIEVANVILKNGDLCKEVSLTVTSVFSTLNAVIADSGIGFVPQMQNTFMGLTIGDVVTESSIKAAMASRGKYSGLEDSIVYKTFTFTDAFFAGQQWDFVTFFVDSKNVFYEFMAYNSYGLYGSDKEKSDRDYSSLKERLASKYGIVKETVEDKTKYVVYTDQIGLTLLFSNSIKESKGGGMRRYVELCYVLMSINNEVSAISDGEL